MFKKMSALAVLIAAAFPAVLDADTDRSMMERSFSYAEKAGLLSQEKLECLDTFFTLDFDLMTEDLGYGFLSKRSADGKTAFCSVASDIPFIDASLSSSDRDIEPTLAADLMETKNKWIWTREKTSSIGSMTVVNPLPVAIQSVVVEFADNDCSGSRGEIYQISFSEEIEPNGVAVIRFLTPVQDMQSAGCLIVVGVDAVKSSQSSDLLDQVIPLARSGQWQKAALATEVLAQNGVDVPGSEKEELKNIILRGVQPLPGSQALRNYEGYAALAALDPLSKVYAQKRDTYFAASRQRRMEEHVAQIRRSLPIILADDVFEDLSSDRTRIQRDTAWEQFKDKAISISGAVEDVKPEGLILPATIIIKTPGGSQAQCYLKDFLSDAVINIKPGSRISCTGILSSYTLLFGILSISINEAEFVQ